MGNWLNLKIDGQAAWPNEETAITFGGCEFVLMPATRKTEQSAHVNLSNISDEEAYTLLSRFLSVLSWCDGVPMEIDDKVCCGRTWKPMPIGRDMSRTVGSCSFGYPFYRDIDPDPKVNLALALYREARTVNSIPYSFLGYYKILNVWWNDKYINGNSELIDGIRGMLPKLQDAFAVGLLSKIAEVESDVPVYLYKSCRCAVAHANKKPTVDPDDWNRIKRLAVDVHIIREIAEILIEEKGVSRSIIG